MAGFSYPLPTMRQQIHNANFLAAALFCRIARLLGEKKFLAPAMKAARFSAGCQRADGGWMYGELAVHQWIDNFHTGYNLDALRSIGQTVGTTQFERCVQKGFDFYRQHFIRPDGAARYFYDRTYPIDAHCVAQTIITLVNFSDSDPTNRALAGTVFDWALKNMWDKRGFFYYRVLPFLTIRTSYMRWSQAWMLQALTTMLEATKLPASKDEGSWSRPVLLG